MSTTLPKDTAPKDTLAQATVCAKNLAEARIITPRFATQLDKVLEEWDELLACQNDPHAAEMEGGDVLMSVISALLQLGIDPNRALQRATAKVANRGAYVKAALAQTGRTTADATRAELDALWAESKQFDQP